MAVLDDSSDDISIMTMASFSEWLDEFLCRLIALLQHLEPNSVMWVMHQSQDYLQFCFMIVVFSSLLYSIGFWPLVYYQLHKTFCWCRNEGLSSSATSGTFLVEDGPYYYCMLEILLGRLSGSLYSQVGLSLLLWKTRNTFPSKRSLIALLL